IFLPHWRSADRGIRFLYLADCCSFRISQSCDTKDSMLPLFLGADLFAKTSIRTENHPRYHAKFAKKGLATKLVFSSFRLHGLRLPTGNNSLWFYSIQGVFRVAFELYSQHEQLSVLEAFQHMEQCMKSGLDERGLSDLVLGLLESQGQGQGAMDPGSVYCSPLLCTIAGWLGHRFNAANGCISQQVESFKMQHIDHITDLPAAEELAGELFPEAMRVLLLNWMGLSDSGAVWKRHSEYPILLLILEFANHNLITGVAHVLYSSLICK
uniref:Uncharacterized protein n=1 Tax=Paramormyrops kingsleyae TaxID=1676925 RepID=A0A3B3RCT1_9TELE